MKKLYIGTNTKMYKGIDATRNFITKLGTLTADVNRDACCIFVIPSFTTLESANGVAKKHHILLGAQNMGWEDEGQFTGEISPVMLQEVGVQIAEIGHSERRHILGEDDAMVNRKVLAAHRHSLIALLCIGETQAQKDYGISCEVLRTQLKMGLYNVPAGDLPKLWIAYEPVWAIGTQGKPASKEYASDIHAQIRKALIELYGEPMAKEVPILYGGSVNAENAKDLICMPDIDGLFIGRSAWDAEAFSGIIHSVLPLFIKTIA